MTRNDATPLSDLSNAPFSIVPPIRAYYVNDGSFTDGDWTTAPGDDANDGLSPATPKASIRAVLEAYQLGAGDVIKVDAGRYPLTANVLVTAQDAGVKIEGYHADAFPGRAATLDRGGGTAAGVYGVELQGTSAPRSTTCPSPARTPGFT